jgi:hypothetical protein
MGTMDAPTCKICGEKHWSRLCNPVTKGVTRTVTRTADVTPAVTCAECERLRDEVAKLKRLLADANGGNMIVTKQAMTGAERVKKLRERRKAK